jgi:YgiT-type zinc finger domain-containing protein
MKSYQRTGPGGFGFVPKKPKLSVLTKCPECGYVMKERAKRTTVTYKDHSKYVTVTAIWCTRCPEGLLDTKATKQMDVAYQKLKKEVDTKPLSTPSSGNIFSDLGVPGLVDSLDAIEARANASTWDCFQVADWVLEHGYPGTKADAAFLSRARSEVLGLIELVRKLQRK